MRVIIMRCKNPKSWYKTMIGKTFTVCELSDKQLMVLELKNNRKLINKDDCEVI